MKYLLIHFYDYFESISFFLYLFRTTLSSNYIKIELEENKGIYEYRVDFDPPVDAKNARFFLINQHREKLPVRTFDGTLLYMPTLLPQNVIIKFLFMHTIY